MLAAKEARERKGRLIVAAMQPIVAEIFKISRFNLVFEVFATLREALASVSPQAAEALDRA
jgi:anti-anti-sigma regulatory factor